jgi:hypothetical protein
MPDERQEMKPIDGTLLLRKFEKWMGEQIREKKICPLEPRMCWPTFSVKNCRACFEKYMEG